MTFLKNFFLSPFETTIFIIFIIHLLYMASVSVAARRVFACSAVFVCQVPHFPVRQSRHALSVLSEGTEGNQSY